MNKSVFIIYIVAIIILDINSVRCVKREEDIKSPLILKNNSSFPIRISFALGMKGRSGGFYPDTNLYVENQYAVSLYPINPGETSAIGGDGSLTSTFKILPDDTLSVFLYNEDTLTKYDWTTICQEYKIIKRYDFSIEDLKRIKKVIVYPPSLEMQNIKQYPPYGE